MGNRKNQYKTFFKNNPSAGAGGAHKFLFFDLITLVNFFNVHFFSPIYLFTINKRYDLDGDFPWNIAGLINHSCENNCDYDGKGLKIWVKAIRDIKKDEELTCDYGFGYDKDYKQFPCKCKSKNCCGYIVRAESRWRINKKFAMGNRKNQYKTFFKNNPSGGAGGAHKFLFFDLITLVNFFNVHFFSPIYFKQPTIDLTCCFKND